MSGQELLPLPFRDPIAGGDLYVTEMASDEGIVIRGRFAVPRLAKLEPEQLSFLESFLRCRGMISSVEKELGISYPTVRSRLDSLLETLGLSAVKEAVPKKPKSLEKKRKILDKLERGEITAEEAKTQIRGGKAK